MQLRIVVFLKAPRPGQVKTRLAASVGQEAASQAYLKLADTFLEQIASYSEVELRFAPDDASQEVERFKKRSEWSLKPQGEGDLGLRMERAVREALMEVDAVICIGTDCPYVRKTDLDQAMEALTRHDAVLGPALDGGYWMIGLTRPESSLFQEMPWSTPQVLDVTRNRLRSAGVSFQELRELEDVDDLESWRRFEALQEKLM